MKRLIVTPLSGRFQRVLNGQTSSWRPVLVGVLKCSNLGPLPFLIYINDLPNKLNSNTKLCSYDTLLFIIIKDRNESADTPKNDVSLISKLPFSWKILCNPDPSKPVKKVSFLRKKKVQFHPTMNNIQSEWVSYHKHLGI